MNIVNQKTTEIDDLPELLGERYTKSRFETSFYQRDLASIPVFLAKLLGNNQPEAVVRPQNIDEVIAVVRYAVARQLALTPRAAATTVYWNSVPLRGGLVVDLTGMRGLVELDDTKPTVTVLAGTRWIEINSILEQRGYTLCSYPTSAPAATVGGWISMVGYGIGSLKYGGMEQLVARLKVVLPDGRLIQVTRDSEPPLSWFLGSEGTLGIITEVEFFIRQKEESNGFHLLAFPSLTALQEAALELTHSKQIPFYMHISTREHMRMLKMAGFMSPADLPLLIVSYEGDKDEVVKGCALVQKNANRYGAVELSEELAEKEWLERFYNLRLKRLGPTLLGAETWLPLRRLTAYEADVARLSRLQNTPIASYANVVMPDQAAVMSLYPSDESRVLGYLFDLSLTNRLYHIAFRHGGRPYGIGFWNMPYQHYTCSKMDLAERRRRKVKLDPMNLMNPGKLYSPPPIILSPAVFNMGMSLLAWLRSAMRIRTWSHLTAD